MSVSLLITSATDGQRGRMLPIASEQIFNQYWVPAATRLKLEFVPLFQTGLPVNREDIPYILDELQQLRTFFETQQVASGTTLTLIERVDGLAHMLEGLLHTSSEDIYIG